MTIVENLLCTSFPHSVLNLLPYSKIQFDRQEMFLLSAVVFLLSEGKQVDYSNFLLCLKFCGDKQLRMIAGMTSHLHNGICNTAF